MEKEIQEIIEKNLPMHVGEALKSRLLQADKYAENAKMYKELADKKDESVRKLNSMISAENVLEERLQRAKRLEADIELRERNLKVELLQCKLDESEKRNSGLYVLIETIFKSPVVRRSILSDVPVVTGNDRYAQTMSASSTETITEE